jgi:hypothetical protein
MHVDILTVIALVAAIVSFLELPAKTRTDLRGACPPRLYSSISVYMGTSESHAA